MTENQILSRELLSFLSSHPKQLKDQGPGYAGKLAVQLGNAILALSYSLEKGQHQVWQPLEEAPLSLYALGKQFREVGLSFWDESSESDNPVIRHLERDIEFLKTRLANLERKGFSNSKTRGEKAVVE